MISVDSRCNDGEETLYRLCFIITTIKSRQVTSNSITSHKINSNDTDAPGGKVKTTFSFYTYNELNGEGKKKKSSCLTLSV